MKTREAALGRGTVPSALDLALAFVIQLRQLKTAGEVLEALTNFSADYGWGTVAIGSVPQAGSSSLPPFFHSNWPGWYQELYESEKLAKNDPVIQYGMSGTRAANWKEISSILRIESGARAFDIAGVHGWRNGLVVPIVGPGGYRAVGSLSSAARDNSPTEQALLHLAVLAAHDQLREINRVQAGFSASPPSSLTPREREVLKWLMAGKTNWEIGEILAISERTVHFHVNQLRRKLKAGNRAQIVAIAMTLGLVDP
jgi:LuxR family quorum sensing-dependent transcriptional regulator